MHEHKDDKPLNHTRFGKGQWVEAAASAFFPGQLPVRPHFLTPEGKVHSSKKQINLKFNLLIN
jgi:hypothetical protein